MLRPGRPAALALLTVAALLVPGVAVGASASLTLDASGTLAVTLTAEVANGSALRSAMDGNFAPLLEIAVANASARTSLLAQINATESNPLLGLLFGNRDGTVTGTEVTTFEGLLTQESQLLPSGSLSGTTAVGLTLDGTAPTSAQLTNIAFLGAPGPDASNAPINTTTSLTYRFALGSGSHTLAFAINLTSIAIPLGVSTAAVDVTVTLPAGTSVDGTQGFDHERTANDPLGWGSPSVAGGFAPTTHTTLSIDFGPAFPTGDILVVVPPLAVAGALGYLWLRRRRRRAQAAS